MCMCMYCRLERLAVYTITLCICMYVCAVRISDALSSTTRNTKENNEIDSTVPVNETRCTAAASFGFCVTCHLLTFRTLSTYHSPVGSYRRNVFEQCDRTTGLHSSLFERYEWYHFDRFIDNSSIGR